MELTKELARELSDSIGLTSEFFDLDNEEYVLLKENNRKLLEAYEVLYTFAYVEEWKGSGDQEDPIDAGRLDFMEKQALTSGTTSKAERVVMFLATYKGKRPPTLRQAIDRAMKEAAEKGRNDA